MEIDANDIELFFYQDAILTSGDKIAAAARKPSA